jgi:hypothetical protein
VGEESAFWIECLCEHTKPFLLMNENVRILALNASLKVFALFPLQTKESSFFFYFFFYIF